MSKVLILLIIFGVCYCHRSRRGIDITVDTVITDENVYHKPKPYMRPHKPNSYSHSRIPPYKVPTKHKNGYSKKLYAKGNYRNEVINEDVHRFLRNFKKYVPRHPPNYKELKPIMRQKITLIARSAEKDHKYGYKRKTANFVPKRYMPVPTPQAISHILGKEYQYNEHKTFVQNMNYYLDNYYEPDKHIVGGNNYY